VYTVVAPPRRALKPRKRKFRRSGLLRRRIAHSAGDMVSALIELKTVVVAIVSPNWL
jgi:hypothetical protein